MKEVMARSVSGRVSPPGIYRASTSTQYLPLFVYRLTLLLY